MHSRGDQRERGGVSLAVAALAAVATSRCVVGLVGNVDDEPTLA
jgi:hypothetical protein